MIKLSVPSTPISSNAAYFNLPGGRGRSLTKEGRKYQNETTAYLVQTYPHELKKVLPDIPYFCYVRFYFPAIENKEGAQTRYKKLDTTNRVKLFEDCLKDACGIDDAQYLIWTLEKRQGKDLTEVFMWNLEQETTPIDELRRL